MREPSELHERIARVFSDALHLDVPSIETDLFDTGVLDSLAFVELLLNLEREFGITTAVDDLDIDNFRTIAHIARYVGAREAAEPTSPSHTRVVQLAIRR